MADDKHKSDDGHDADHGGDHGDHGGSDKPSKASSGGSGGGKGGASLLRNPLVWGIAGVGALLVAVFGSGILTSTDGTAPSSYSVSDSQDVADSDRPSSPGARRTTARRIGARTCVSIVQRARADYGRDWESELSRKVRADCDRAIQEARRANGRAPQQAEGPRGKPGAIEVERMSVAYSDLDLTTSAGAERFLARLRSAAVRVCGGRPDLRDLEARRAFKDCVDRNMDGAVAQLRAPRVTALHQQRAG